ncbi:hypothetical protein [uncultured Pontibacter sp.]|uniref:hypothetical protein n=1 Tax=uncultured Pontibacter sp. TaxID=453356 RepID=UPI00260877D3|nr:hypothetical protein [uncultured Pontibacter sp.]
MKLKHYLIPIAFLAISCSASKNTGSTSNTASAKGMVDYGSPVHEQKLLNETTFVIAEVSEDKTYGYDSKNPIMVGGADKSEGPLNERRFLNALAGPDGEVISYHRLGSCCSFQSKNGMMGGGLLDKYSITYEGLAEPIILYINMYDSAKLKVPVGFTLKK